MLAEVAEDLVRRVLADHPKEKTISLLAIAVTNLAQHPIAQLELPTERSTQSAVALDGRLLDTRYRSACGEAYRKLWKCALERRRP